MLWESLTARQINEDAEIVLKLDKSRIDIPMKIKVLEKDLALTFATIFVPPLDNGHYVSIVQHNNEYYLMDDNNVTKLRECSVSSALKKNTYGYVYGVCYSQI